MKNAILLAFMMLFTLTITAQDNIVRGTVTHEGIPLVNAEIEVADSGMQVKTDGKGRYKILAEEGDVVLFQYPSMTTVRIVIEDITSVLNVALEPKVNELKEVVVRNSNRKSQDELAQEYATNKNLIKTAFGIIDGETSPGNVRFLNEDQINPIGLCILDLVRNEFPGVEVRGNCITGGDIIVRGFSSLTKTTGAIFDIDGMIFNDAPLWLVPGNIHRIAILNNLATTTRYGSIAAGGAVVINTKNSIASSDKLVDKAKVRNNIFANNALSETSPRQNPIYLKELIGSSNREEAERIYEKHAIAYKGSYHFYLDAFNYFNDRWKDTGFAKDIIESNWSVFENNPVALKSLAYIYQANANLDGANDIYKKVLKLRPRYAQSYLDLATSYRELDEYQMAATILMRYKYLAENDFLEPDTEVFSKILDRELNNLLALHGAQVISEQDFKKHVLEEEFDGTRLVFEWSDSEAEFDLQFVNPMNRYYNWSHTLSDNPARIMQEKQVGYNTEEYLIDDELRGTWLVNLNYLGNKSLTPTYLKATIYHNYGSASQKKETKVFRLSLKEVNQKLFSVSNGVSVAVR